MPESPNHQSQSGLAQDEIRAHLAKIQQSDPFVRSKQIQRLLQFLVEGVIADDHDRLKETVIGIEVFNRSPGYDPKLDPVVRVEARRLRAKLHEYYLHQGKTDPLLIRLDKGNYVPLLTPRSAVVQTSGESGPQSPLPPPPPLAEWHVAAAGFPAPAERARSRSWHGFCRCC
jgi:hypothetical protein